MAACLHTLYAGKKELVEGFNSLGDVENTFVITAT